MTVYKENLKEVKDEREKLYETAIEGRRTIETIARRVTALYFKLKCHELDQDKLTSSKNSLPPQLQTDRKLTTIGGGEVSERNILNLMELIETRSIQIVEAYLKQLSERPSLRSRRPSLILVRMVVCRCMVSLICTHTQRTFSLSLQSPSMFDGFTTRRLPEALSEESDETESSSDDDEDFSFGRPVSVQDIRREEKLKGARPGTAKSSASGPHASPEKANAILPRHTVI